MWATLIPLAIQTLSAIQPLSSGIDQNKISGAGENLIPVFERLFSGMTPGAQVNLPFVVSEVTSVFDPDMVKWIQNILNKTGNNLTVDGNLGPLTLAAADSFAARYLGIVPGGLISQILKSGLTSLAAKESLG